jgi:REP element-mobilizing transposase RayT
MNRGRRGEKIFETKEDYWSFIDLLCELNEVFNVKVAAYCLMSNHYHLLVKTPDANLSRSMRHLNGVYTQRYNRRHSCDGQLFRGRYKSIVVEADSYALELVRYIHRNPFEAGLVDNFQKYQWSSHRAYLTNSKKWKWLYRDYILRLFSRSRPESIRLYKQFVFKETPEEINRIFGRRKLPAVLGGKKFVDKIKDRFFNLKDFEEIPETKRIAPDIEEIIYAVCNAYNVKEAELYVTRRGYFNEPRNVSVYLIRHLRNDTLKQVGERFGIDKYSTVSSIVEKVKHEMKRDKRLKKLVQNLAERIAKSQRQT